MSDLTRGLAALTTSSERYLHAEAMYVGNVPEVFTSRRLAHALRHAGMKFRLNFARTPVMAVADRMEITAVEATADVRANTALQVVWEENQMQLWANDVHRDALKLGDYYVFVWPDPDGFPELHLASPLHTRIVYDTQFLRRKLYAITTWPEADDTSTGTEVRTRADLYYPDRIERYITTALGSTTGTLPLEDVAWELYADQQSDGDPLPNPFEEIPFFHYRTERPFGTPEHFSAYGAQDAINKHVVQQIAANDFQSFPQRYLLSEMGGIAIPGSPGSNGTEDWDDEVPVGGDGANVSSGAQGGPGTLLEFVGKNLTIGEFQAAQPSVFLEPLRFYVQAMSAVTSTPLHLFEGMGDVPSGESLRAAEAPLNKKVRDRAMSFGSTWQECLSFALKVVGLDSDVTLNWADPSSVDTKDKWDVVAAKIAAGVPVEVALQEAGYDLAQVQSWLAGAAPTPEPEPAPTDAAVAAGEATAEPVT